jgi:hypothetical protein
MAERPRVDPNQVRQLQPGEAFVIQAGRAVKLSVLQAPVPAKVQEEASALRATAMSAAEPVYVAEGIVGAPPQVELWQSPQPALDQRDPAPLLGLAAPSDDGQTTAPAGAPPCPPPRAPASCSPCAAPSPPATRPPSPPSSKRATARRPAGTYRRPRSAPGRSPLAAAAYISAVPGPGGPPWAGARWLSVGQLSGGGRGEAAGI